MADSVPANKGSAPRDGAGGGAGPSDFLKTVIGRPVVVRLNTGVDYRGKTASRPLARRPPAHLPSDVRARTAHALASRAALRRAQAFWRASMAT